jgi:hypothetical protein
MTKTKKRPGKPEAKDPKAQNHAFKIEAKDEAEVKQALARALASPVVNAANSIASFNGNHDYLDVTALANELVAQCDVVKSGDLSRVEAMLLSQAHALQAIFTNCAWRMSKAEYLSQHQSYGLLALKAQNQCRATLATLAEIKNPNRATFIKNTATNQQVNVGASAPKISDDPPNELLEAKPHERLDTTTQSPTSAADQKMETVGMRHRTKDGRG